MKNTASAGAEILPDGIISFYLAGDLDVATLRPVLSKVDEYTEQLIAENKPVLVLADASNLDIVQLESRKYGVNWLKTAKYDKVSVHGSSVFMKYLVGMYVRLIGSKMHYTDNREEAIQWLKKK